MYLSSIKNLTTDFKLAARTWTRSSEYWRLMMELLTFVSMFAPSVSFLTQLIGIKICFDVIKKGTTGELSVVPFLTFFAGACLWVRYGLIQELFSLITVNVVAAVLNFIYIVVFYFHTVRKSHLHRLILLTVIVLFSPLIYIKYFQKDSDLAVAHLGFICCIVSVLSYAAPLSTFKEVVRNKSTESMSFPLVLLNSFCGVAWSIYGGLVHDSYIILPNFVGTIFTIVQLYLFLKFRSKKSDVTVM